MAAAANVGLFASGFASLTRFATGRSGPDKEAKVETNVVAKEGSSV